MAGVGTGKTHIGGFKSGYLISKFPTVPGFVGANTYQQMSTSTLKRVRAVWREYFNWIEGIHYVVGKQPPKHFNTEGHDLDSYSSVISFLWGTIVFKGSLDNYKAHDGKEIGWAVLDETKDTKEEAVKDTILTRLRHPGIYLDDNNQLTSEVTGRPHNPLYILTSPSKVDWINKWFKLDELQEEILSVIFEKDNFFRIEFDDKSVVISSTYHNIGNLPSNFISKLVANQGKASAEKLIYGNPFVRTGAEFYTGFDRRTHVKETHFNPDLPLHLSLDQNVTPYITGTVYQIEEIGELTYIRQLDEICLPNPRNTTKKLCIEFIKRWGARCKSGLFFYGDATGTRRDTRGEAHDYDIVEKMLRSYINNNSNRVPRSNPRVLHRRDFANAILEGATHLMFEVDPRCKKSIADFEFVKEDINGKKKKEVITDPDTKEKYEPYGHTSDSFDYFVCEANRDLFRREFKR